MEKKTKNGWALGALTAGILTYVLGFFLGTGDLILVIITIICGIIGLKKYKDTPEIGGKWESIAGILIVVIYVVLIFILTGIRRGALF